MELTFSVGSPRNCQDIPIQDDDILEGTENLFTNLSTSDPDVILAPDVTEVLILEDPNDSMYRLIIFKDSVFNVWLSSRCNDWL